MSDALDKVFDHIVRSYAITDTYIDVDLLADATDEGKALNAEKAALATKEQNQATKMRGAFREGLLAAYRADRADKQELRLSDQDPQENAMADALIRYLVSFGFASSHSEQTAPMQYDYYFAVNWDELGKLASEVGVDLNKTLAETA